MSVPRISRTSRVPRPGIDWFNKVGQAVNAHEQQSKAFGPRQARGLNLDPDRLIVLVKNTTLSDIGRYRPIDIDGAALEESDDILLLGVDPNGGVYGIAQEPIPAGKIGRVCIQGVTRAYIEFPATTGDKLATFAETSHLATGNGNGVVLFDFASSTDTVKLGIILLGGGGGSSCKALYDFRFLNQPLSGTGTVTVTYNAVAEDIDIDVSACADTDVKSAIDAHSELVAATLECTIVGGTGTMYGGNVLIRTPPGCTVKYKTASLTKTPTAPLPEFVAWECGSCS